MSQQLIARSSDLRQLAAEGYALEIKHGHLLVHDIPHVDAGKNVVRGTFIVPVTIQDGQTGPPPSHVMLFNGQTPCDREGREIEQIKHGGPVCLAEGLDATHSFSNKPENGYGNYYDMVTTYTNVLGASAQQLDPSVTARTGHIVIADVDDSVFRFMDTASARAGIGAVMSRLDVAPVAIIGLGGTGAHVLDLLVKCPVREIRLFDGDRFFQHNAFRSPGATSEVDLKGAPYKVDFYRDRYDVFRSGIVAHREYVTAGSAERLAGISFAFVCVDSGPARREVTELLEQLDVPFIDVGMGLTVDQEARSIDGAVRVTTSLPGRRQQARNHLPLSPDDVDNVYASNIQVSAMNALNAALAVARWQRTLGFYTDFEDETQAVYTLSTNAIIRERGQ